MEHDFGPELSEEFLDEGLAREWRNLHRAFDISKDRPAPYHTYYDAGDEQELHAAKAAGNTMVVHLEFGSSIETDPGVTRNCCVCLPRLCLVSFAKRAICRQLCPGLYPSFIRLSQPDTGDVLEDVGPATRDGGGPGAKRTLASYDVGHDSVLQLDIVEGNIFEAIDLNDLAKEGAPEAAAGRPAAATAAAATAAAARGNPPTAGQGRQQAGKRALEAVDGNANRPRKAAGSPKRRAWSREETIALLRGIIKHKGGLWRFILEDTSFAETLAGRTGVNLKDRWVNLQKAAERGFQNMKHNAAKDTELIDLVREAQEASGIL